MLKISIADLMCKITHRQTENRRRYDTSTAQVFQLVLLITINSYHMISLTVRFVSVRTQSGVLLHCSPGSEKRYFIHWEKCYISDV